MIIEDYRLIYVHVPKTAGNSTSHLLLPYAEEKMVLSRFQDGWDRFEMKGAVCKGKHMTLAAYRSALGEARFAGYHVATATRNPLDRAISFYFSPHRWMALHDGAWRLQPARWSLEDFRVVIQEMRGMADYFDMDGRFRRPDHLIRFEAMRKGLAALAAATGLPLDCGALPHVNRSAADAAMRAVIRRDDTVRKLVADRFARDFDLFEYSMPN